MERRKFRIGALAKELKVKKFVIRFWEKEFGLKSTRSQGGQRYYTEEDFKAFDAIKTLLYSQGYTIAGAKAQLQKVLKRDVTAEEKPAGITAATKIVEKPVPYVPEELLAQVRTLKKQLIELKNLIE